MIVENRPVDNPCTPANLAKMELIHPHPYDANLFIKCDLLGRMYITLCPNDAIFNKVSIRCGLGRKYIRFFLKVSIRCGFGQMYVNL